MNLPAESTQTPVKGSPSDVSAATPSVNTALTGQTAGQVDGRPSGQIGGQPGGRTAGQLSGRTGAAAVSSPRGEDPLGLLAAALEYIEDRHWEVVLGTRAHRRESGWACSCESPDCALAGAHPAHRDWHRRISGQPSKAHEWWSAAPAASVLLPTGRTFDVLETSEAAGCLALARMEGAGVAVGPVSAIPSRRMFFFVLPNACAKTQRMLAGLGWAPGRLDLVCRGAGDYVVAPPSRLGPLGHAQWVRQPSDGNRWLPDVEELLAPLAYACGVHR